MSHTASMTHFNAQPQFGLAEEWIVRWSCADGVAREAIFTDKAEALSLLDRLGYTA